MSATVSSSAITTLATIATLDDSALVHQCGVRLSVQTSSTRDSGLGFSAYYFTLTAAYVYNASLLAPEVVDLVDRSKVAKVWRSAKKLLDAEQAHLKAGKGTFAVTGGVSKDTLSAFRRDLRAVIGLYGASLGRTKPAAVSPAAAEPLSLAL